MPKRGDEIATAMGQWAGGTPNDKRMVVVDEGTVGVSRRERREVAETTPVVRSTEAWIVVGRKSAEKEERVTPVFDDMEIAVWTTAREEALKKVTEDAMTDEGELSPQMLDGNRQKYKEMLSSLALMDATEEEYRKTSGIGQPYRGMARPFWQKWRFAMVAEEVHTVYLQEKWVRMEVRNQKRFITAVRWLTALELTRLGGSLKKRCQGGTTRSCTRR